MRAPFTLLAGSTDSPANAARFSGRRRSSPRKQHQSTSRTPVSTQNKENTKQESCSPSKRKLVEAVPCSAKAAHFEAAQEDETDSVANMSSAMTSSTAFILDDMSSEDEAELEEGLGKGSLKRPMETEQEVHDTLAVLSSRPPTLLDAAVTHEPTEHVTPEAVNNELTEEYPRAQVAAGGEKAAAEDVDAIAHVVKIPEAQDELMDAPNALLEEEQTQHPEASSSISIEQLPPLPESPIKSSQVEEAFQAEHPAAASPTPSNSIRPEMIPLPLSPETHRTHAEALSTPDVATGASPNVSASDLHDTTLLASPQKSTLVEQTFQTAKTSTPSPTATRSAQVQLASQVEADDPMDIMEELDTPPLDEPSEAIKETAEDAAMSEETVFGAHKAIGTDELPVHHAEPLLQPVLESGSTALDEMQVEEKVSENHGMDSMDLDSSPPSIVEASLPEPVNDSHETQHDDDRKSEAEVEEIVQEGDHLGESVTDDSQSRPSSLERVEGEETTSVKSDTLQEVGSASSEAECQISQTETVEMSTVSTTEETYASPSLATSIDTTPLSPPLNVETEAVRLKCPNSPAKELVAEELQLETAERAHSPTLDIEEHTGGSSNADASRVDTVESAVPTGEGEDLAEEQVSSPGRHIDDQVVMPFASETERQEDNGTQLASGLEASAQLSDATDERREGNQSESMGEENDRVQENAHDISPCPSATAKSSLSDNSAPQMIIEEPSETSIEIGRGEPGPSLSVPGTPTLQMPSPSPPRDSVLEDQLQENPAVSQSEPDEQTPATSALTTQFDVHPSPIASTTAHADAPTTKRRTLSRKSSKSRIVNQARPQDLERTAMLAVEAPPPRRSANRSLSPSLSIENLVAVAAEEPVAPAQVKDKRKGRKRSLSVISRLEDSEAETREPSEPFPVQRSRTRSASVSGSKQEAQEELERPHTPPMSSVQPLPAKRQSRRIAAVSGLPQPKPSGIAKAKRSESTTAKKQKTVAASSTSDKKGKGKAKQEEEEEDAAFEIVQTQAVAASAQANGRPSALPQRSARPTRSRNNGNILRSPSRVLSPQKKPASKSMESATANVIQKSGKTVLHMSPQRVPLPKKAGSSSVTFPRSPPRGGDWKWPSPAQQQLKSSIRGPYSPEATRRVAKNVFGSSVSSSTAARPAACFPAFPVASTSSSTAQPSSSQASATASVSPIKGLAQHLSGPASPGLLGLSLAPESLVLAAPPPRPKAPMSPSRAPIIGVSAAARDMSLPPAVTAATAAARATFGSPRRAHSAQPPASPRKLEISSPRRVPIPGGIAPFALPELTVKQDYTREESRKLPPSPRRVPIVAPSRSLQPTSSTSSLAANDGVPIASKAGPARAAQRSVRTSARRVVSAPVSFQPAASTSQLPVHVPPALSAAQLSALTNKNTSFNKKQYNVHSVTVIHKDENRPPSPTSKIRKIIEEPVEVASTSSSKKQDKKALQQASSASLESHVDEHDGMLAAGVKRPHFRAAGDEGLYESPAKGSTSEGDAEQQSKKARTLKWDRELLKQSEEIRTPRRAKARAAELLQSKRPYRKVPLPLDAFGNSLDSKASLSPVVPRTRVPISKIIYKDDPQE